MPEIWPLVALGSLTAVVVGVLALGSLLRDLQNRVSKATKPSPRKTKRDVRQLIRQLGGDIDWNFVAWGKGVSRDDYPRRVCELHPRMERFIRAVADHSSLGKAMIRDDPDKCAWHLWVDRPPVTSSDEIARDSLPDDELHVCLRLIDAFEEGVGRWPAVAGTLRVTLVEFYGPHQTRRFRDVGEMTAYGPHTGGYSEPTIAALTWAPYCDAAAFDRRMTGFEERLGELQSVVIEWRRSRTPTEETPPFSGSD